MRKLYILKTIVDLFWFFSLLAALALLIFLPILFFSSEPIDIPINIGGTEMLVLDLISKIIIFGLFLSYCFFMYGIFLFKKVLSLFAEKQIFEAKVIVLLNRIGVFFLIASVIAVVMQFFARAYVKDEIGISLGSGFDSFLFTSSIGLFFMVLAEVFQTGKNMKEENDLTI